MQYIFAEATACFTIQISNQRLIWTPVDEDERGGGRNLKSQTFVNIVNGRPLTVKSSKEIHVNLNLCRLSFH